jgi:hypothetical protein
VVSRGRVLALGLWPGFRHGFPKLLLQLVSWVTTVRFDLEPLRRLRPAKRQAPDAYVMTRVKPCRGPTRRKLKAASTPNKIEPRRAAPTSQPDTPPPYFQPGIPMPCFPAWSSCSLPSHGLSPEPEAKAQAQPEAEAEAEA